MPHEEQGTLSGEDLKNRLKLDPSDEHCLVLAPLLEPEKQLSSDEASIDIRLGCQFALVAPSVYGAIDEFDRTEMAESPQYFRRLYRKVYIPLGEGLVIHPHQFMLGTTLEYMRLPGDLMSYVVGRSTWGRLGLIVATAIGIHPWFAGCLTLELRNLGESPIRLYPGQTVAQLFFHKVAKGKGRPGQVGQYSGTVDLLPKSLSSTKTHTVLSNLKERREILRKRLREGE